MAAEGLTVEDITGIVIGLLAEQAGISPAQMRGELQAAGPGLPVDSLLIAEILTRVEDVCGARIPADAAAARSTGSVTAFAHVVFRSIPQGGVA